MKDVIAELRVGVKDLAAEDRAGWVPLALSDRVRDLVGLSEVMQVEVVRALAGWDRVTGWAEDGAVSPTPWLGKNTALTKAEAVGLIRVARLFAQHPSVTAGMDGGELTVAKARRFTPRQRRASMLRDGGCVFPGCDRKPKWCDAHHLRAWEHDGPTDLANGCLLCRRHHNLIHHIGWTLERDHLTGIFIATSPDGRTSTRGLHDRCPP